MEIQTSLLPRHCGNAEVSRQNVECPAPGPRKNNFRVAARRQTAANFSALFQSAALCRDAATANNLEILARPLFVAATPSSRNPTVTIFN